MSSPKEKAIELYYKFSSKTESFYQTKKCALIAVDEMLSYFSRESFKMAYPEIAIPEIEYLEEVKQEIQKL